MTLREDRRLIDMEVLERVAPIIRSAAHPLRLRILDYLQCEGEPCSVSRIAGAAGAPQAFVSQQLRILKDQGVLTCRRHGSFILYNIANPALLHLLECIRKHQGERR
jgi:DNA-binding transcriptional ArsR family regulator